MNHEDLAAGVRAGDHRALARALTGVENRRPEARRLVAELYPQTGKSAVWGLTGPPGVGKSTLADAIATHALRKGRKVAILAIDPTSPYTGGAFLGDRTRMEASSQSADVFIRSMATRGHIGGLAAAAFEAVTLLDAAGKDLILVETVGVGQDEVEVAAAVGLTLVVLAPGLGDELQANKAGLLEIADVLVVNKADRDGAHRLAEELASTHRDSAKAPAIVSTVATIGEGVDRLYQAVSSLGASPELRRRRFVEGWLSEVLQQALREHVADSVWEEAVNSVLSSSTDPFAAAERVFESLHRPSGRDGEVTRIHHIGIAVHSVDEAAGRFGGLLGLERGERYDLPEWQVSALFLPVGESHLELLEPHGEESSVGKFLARRGEGLHHICFEVEDIEASLREFARQGARLVDEEPRPGAGGHLVAFVHPQSSHGVLVELKQRD